MQDLIALLDKPLVLLIVMAIGGLIGIAVEKAFNTMERKQRRSYWRGRNWRARTMRPTDRPPVPRAAGGTAFAADQLRLVMQADFTRRTLLNPKERRLLAWLDKILAEEAPSCRAMGQVSLGEVISSKDEKAYFAVNSKRVDLLIVDDRCQPLFALEYQGTGHYLGQTAIARDAVKMEALRKAGIGYETIKPGDTPAELRALVRKIARRDADRSGRQQSPEQSPA
jgi:hypothetical protein